MITGLEPFVAKAAAPAVSKLAGWTASGAMQRIRDLRVQRRMEDQTPEERPLVDGYTAAEVDSLISLFESAEFEQIAINITVAHYLKKCSNQEFSRDAIEQQLRELVRLSTPLTDPAVVQVLTLKVYDELEKNVLIESSQLLAGTNGLPDHTRAALVKHAAALGSNLTRNSELLSQLHSLSDIRTFENELRVQIANLHRSMRLPHAGISRQVPYNKLFVQPSISRRVSSSNNTHNSLIEVLNHGLRVVLLGDPGGGKSTASLKLTHDIATGAYPDAPNRTPFLVVLKDYAEEYTARRTSILDFLSMLCATPYAVPPPAGAIEYMLRNGSAIIIFDGLDELLATALRTDIVQAVEGFASRFPLTAILVTSRKVGYDEAPLDEETFVVADLEGFGAAQVESYARRWFNLDESIPEGQRTSLAKSFLTDSDYVSDLRQNPLMLSLMCGLYSGERYIPRNRPDVYEKCANLLFERWDKQRGIVAPLPFDAHVQSSLRSLALWLYPQQERRKGLPRGEFIEFMTQYLRVKRFDDEDEARDAAVEFIDFCRGRAWVLTDVGAEQYWFTHQTFLEFFAASQLVREHTSPDRLFRQLWPRICQAEWDVVAQLALQTLGKAVEDGADDFLALLITEASQLDIDGERQNALSFAARALAFVVPKPSVLKDIVTSCVNHYVENWPVIDDRGTTESKQTRNRPVRDLGQASAENVPLIRKYVTEVLQECCASNPPDERALALGLYWNSIVRSPSRVRGTVSRPTADEYRFQVGLNRALDGAANRGAERFAWVFAYLVEDGKRNVSDLVRMFGVGALYECEYGGEVIDPPLAWKIIRSREPWPNPKGRVVDRGLVQGVYNSLLSTDLPWFTYNRKMNPMLGVSSGIDANVSAKTDILWRSTALLLALPMLEVRSPPLRVDPTGRRPTHAPKRHTRKLPDFVDGRDADRGRDYVQTELERLRRFDVTSEVRDISQDWIARRVSAVRRGTESQPE